MSDIILGDYKIESELGKYGTVHKALGPWPLRNWSWVSFYTGTIDECKSYIEWAQRIDSNDKNIIDECIKWYNVPVSNRDKFVAHAYHFPKMMGYNFKNALDKCPKQPDVETSPEAVLLIFIIPVILLFAALYHMM